MKLTHDETRKLNECLREILADPTVQYINLCVINMHMEMLSIYGIDFDNETIALWDTLLDRILESNPDSLKLSKEDYSILIDLVVGAARELQKT